jgi:hypothetical protein
MRRTPTLVFVTLVAILAAGGLPLGASAQGLFSRQDDTANPTSGLPRSSVRVQIGGANQGQNNPQSLASRLSSSPGLSSLSKAITSGADGGQNQQNPQNQQNQGQSGPTNRVGVLSGTERFLRENRRVGEFVGADSDDATKFVGAQTYGADITVPPAEEPMAPPLQSAPNPDQVNVPIPTAAARAARPYEPRLAVGFELPPQTAAELNLEMVRRLKAIPGLHPANRIEVSVEGRIATLRGEVACERDRVLSGQLLLFEPGISEVRNALTVRPPAQTPAEAPPAPPPNDQGWRPSARR